MKSLLLSLLLVASIFSFGQIQVVTLDGSLSVDRDGSLVKYEWTQVGITPSLCVISNADKAIATVVPANGLQWQPGVYTFQLVVTDNQGAVSQPSITHVTITSNAPTVDPGQAQIVQLPVNVHLQATAKASLGIIKTWSWTQTAGPNTAIFSRKDSSGTFISGLIVGTYNFKITVTDGFGATATGSTTVTVKAANTAPSSNAGPDQQITLPLTTVTVGALDNPPNATISWKKISGGSSFKILSPFSSVTQITAMARGKYVFEKSVEANGMTAKDEVMVTVKKKCSWLAKIFGCK
jgi:chitodextrinase